MEERADADGDLILEEGDFSDFAYQIVSGDVEIFKIVDGQRVVLGHAGPGEYLGEMGLIDDSPRSASARAQGRVEAMLLERCEFLKEMSQDSARAYRLLARLSERLRHTSARLAEAASAEPLAEPFVHPPGQARERVPAGPRVVRRDSLCLPASDGAVGTLVTGHVTIRAGSKTTASHVPKRGMVIETFPFTVGRSSRSLRRGPEAVPLSLALPDSPPYRLSRLHFAIDESPAGPLVRDLGSTLGTTVNGESLGHQFGKDSLQLKLGENEVRAGGADSAFHFTVVVDPSG